MKVKSFSISKRQNKKKKKIGYFLRKSKYNKMNFLIFK